MSDNQEGHLNHFFNQTSQNWHLSVEGNDEKPIDLLEVQPELTVEEPIEQVCPQEPEDARLVEPTMESEDQKGNDETAKLEEGLDAPNVKEHKH